MKRGAFGILLLVLAVLELLLLESFLPYGWHHPIYELLQRLFPGQPYAPHPRIDLEIEIVLRQHLFWRIGIYLVAAVLTVGNAFALFRVWNGFRRSRKSGVGFG